MPSDDTTIEWCDATWNPVHGCSKISEGCVNCYAAKLSQRYGHTECEWTAEHADENVQLQRHHLDYPDSLDEPARVFVNSMSDLFHEQVPDEYIHEVLDVVEGNPQHAFLVLTKHGTENGRLPSWSRWPENLWMGVSVEQGNRTYRIDQLRETDAATKWVSAEPLVGPVTTSLEGIDWLVVSGESGPDDHRREMHHGWARALRQQARHDGVPFYFKQSSGPQQGHEPVLAEIGASPQEARATLGEPKATTKHRELPALPGPLRETRPELATREVRV